MTAAKGFSNRQIRSTVNRQGAVIEESVMPTLQQCIETISGLADNQRALAAAIQAAGEREAKRSRSLWSRLGWVVRGAA